MLYSAQIQRLRNSMVTGDTGMAPPKGLPLLPFPPSLLSLSYLSYSHLNTLCSQEEKF